jgi:hypothetical protein
MRLPLDIKFLGDKELKLDVTLDKRLGDIFYGDIGLRSDPNGRPAPVPDLDCLRYSRRLARPRRTWMAGISG